MQRKYLKINRKQFSLLEGMVVKHSFDGYIIICRDSRENEVLSPVLSCHWRVFEMTELNFTMLNIVKEM